MQTISRKNLKIIYNSGICEGYKTKITEALFEQETPLIKVEENELMEAYSKADNNQKKLLEKHFKIETPESRFKKITNFDSILKLSGQKLEDILPWMENKNLTKKKKSQNALAKIQLISEVYNNGVELDFDNPNQRKYYIWWKKQDGAWLVGVVYGLYCADAGFGCYFVNEECARDASKKFSNIFSEYLP
jgi:hypothetical protein